jgi:formylglycine-generating enzyme required for sulfatase activity
MNTNFRWFLIALACVAEVHSSPAQPLLGIAPTNNQAILFWTRSTSGTNDILQVNSNLAPTNWLSATDAFPLVYGSQTAFTVTNSSPARFFRLSVVAPAADGMVLIPGGWFTMGDPLDGEADAVPTNVYVSSFYMEPSLVSYSAWQAVFSYAASNGYHFAYAGSGKGTNQPVQYVQWYDVVKWCNARSVMAGLTPVYYTDTNFTKLYTNGSIDAIYPDWSADGYRLPTEAEWEKAARGGLISQRFPWGNSISESQANYLAAPGSYSYDAGPYTGYNTNFNNGGTPYTSPVGYFAANNYGINDMAGNVFEWCWDWYGIPYGQPTPVNPTGPLVGSNRVDRGGEWNGSAYVARCANRGGNNPPYALDYIGFRCVRRY